MHREGRELSNPQAAPIMAAGDPKVFGMGVGKDEANKPQGIHELEDTGNTVATLPKDHQALYRSPACLASSHVDRHHGSHGEVLLLRPGSSPTRKMVRTTATTL